MLALTRSEMEVDADLSAVHVQRAGRDSRRELGGEEGLATEAAIEVLGLERPVRHEHPFRARAHGPTRERLAIAESQAERGRADRGVRQGKAAGAVKQ